VLETLANLGEFIGAVGVIVSIGYLAIQIRQNTKAVRSSSYHQAAEQTWSSCLAVAQNAELAGILVRAQEGRPLTPEETLRLAMQDNAMIYGFENMLRLHEEDLLDSDVYRNVIDNSLPYLTSPRIQELLRGRPGPLSTRLAEQANERARELGMTPAP
jgi:hypothetical protein